MEAQTSDIAAGLLGGARYPRPAPSPLSVLFLTEINNGLMVVLHMPILRIYLLIYQGRFLCIIFPLSFSICLSLSPTFTTEAHKYR